MDCYGVTPSGDILIPSGSDEDGEGQREEERGEEAGAGEADKVVLLASTGVQDVSWHPSAEAAKEEENTNPEPPLSLALRQFKKKKITTQSPLSAWHPKKFSSAIQNFLRF